MRISQLSRTSGVPIATLKYYLREGLLPPGAPTAVNQAEYGDEHLRRLRLIAVLTDIGGLSLRAVGNVLDAIDDDHLSTHRMLGVAHHALGPHDDDERLPPDVEAAQADVDRLLRARRWRVSPGAPARRALARALATLRRMGRDPDAAVLDRYADAADRLAAEELTSVITTGSRIDAIENLVVGTVVFESVLLALRRLAQEHHSARRLTASRRSSSASQQPV